MGIGLFIIPRTWRLLREAVGILLEGTPSHINLAAVRAAMEDVPGVESVHDLHVWSITSGYVALSAHVRVRDGVDRSQALAELSVALRERFKIGHTTLQIEEGDVEEIQRHP